MRIRRDAPITSQVKRQDGGVAITVEGQSQRPKVLKWPNREAIMGYVGAAEIAGMPTDLWLYHSFIGNNLNFSDFATLARSLQTELDSQLSSCGLSGPLIIHLGFEPESGGSRPIVWFIRNTTALTPTGAYVVGTRFDASEELASPAYFGTKPGAEIRRELSAGLYFSFRQGYDLPAFNTIDEKLREAMAIIVHGHPGQTHPVPSDLDEWAKHVRLAVNGYGAYFASFFEPYEQYVGGGADVVYARWP